jgi:hypothetical protein
MGVKHLQQMLQQSFNSWSVAAAVEALLHQGTPEHTIKGYD